MAKPDRNFDDLFQAYLEGRLDVRAEQEVEAMLQADPELAERLDPQARQLQDRIDDSLQRLFAPPATPELDFLSLTPAAERAAADKVFLNQPGDDASPSRLARRRLTLALAIAAAIAWLAVGTQLLWPTGRAIAFRERPLTELYQQCVAEGFKPYWVCEDDALFAATFEKRQGVALQLAAMPAGRKMVGLSYLAGLSRKSTSLLALVDQHPVIVFVDRLENDWQPAIGRFEEAGLTVTRVEKRGFVLYEVSPLGYTTVVDFLLPAAEQNVPPR